MAEVRYGYHNYEGDAAHCNNNENDIITIAHPDCVNEKPNPIDQNHAGINTANNIGDNRDDHLSLAKARVQPVNHQDRERESERKKNEKADHTSLCTGRTSLCRIILLSVIAMEAIAWGLGHFLRNQSSTSAGAATTAAGVNNGTYANANGSFYGCYNQSHNISSAEQYCQAFAKQYYLNQLNEQRCNISVQNINCEQEDICPNVNVTGRTTSFAPTRPPTKPLPPTPVNPTTSSSTSTTLSSTIRLSTISPVVPPTLAPTSVPSKSVSLSPSQSPILPSSKGPTQAPATGSPTSTTIAPTTGPTSPPTPSQWDQQMKLTGKFSYNCAYLYTQCNNYNRSPLVIGLLDANYNETFPNNGSTEAVCDNYRNYTNSGVQAGYDKSQIIKDENAILGTPLTDLEKQNTFSALRSAYNSEC